MKLTDTEVKKEQEKERKKKGKYNKNDKGSAGLRRFKKIVKLKQQGLRTITWMHNDGDDDNNFRRNQRIT